MRIRERYDRWETDHPFCDANHSLNAMIEVWMESNTRASEGVLVARSKRERHKLAYIIYSLHRGQEYDGGNAILWATQDGSLSDGAVRLLATLFVSGEIRFSSKIGQVIFVRIGRSLGLHLCDLSQRDVGLPLLRMAVETTSNLRYGKQAARREWEDFKHEVTPLPEYLDDIMRGLE